ncbi:hypothetical protein F4604DRAFT_1681466 [Suillus subluteus]|nr:hypothetical protein F4604DRAFT_1681466 [Suillus subluteus]
MFNGNYSYVEPLSGAEYEMILVGQPKLVPKKLQILLNNQIATLFEVTDAHAEEATHVGCERLDRIVLWKLSGMLDTIVVHTEPLYTVSQQTHPHAPAVEKEQNCKSAEATLMSKVDNLHRKGEDDVANEASGILNRSIKDLYDPHVLPDYNGELFQHQEAKLHQLDIRNTDNLLIPPKEWYENFHQGALIYHIHAHTICIIDKAGLPIQPRACASQIGAFQIVGKCVRSPTGDEDSS